MDSISHVLTFFLNSLKNVKLYIFFSSKPLQKQAAGWIWPACHSLPGRE